MQNVTLEKKKNNQYTSYIYFRSMQPNTRLTDRLTYSPSKSKRRIYRAVGREMESSMAKKLSFPAKLREEWPEFLEVLSE